MNENHSELCPSPEWADWIQGELLPSLLQAVRVNLRHDPRVAIFEVGHVYQQAAAELIASRRVTLGLSRSRSGENSIVRGCTGEL